MKYRIIVELKSVRYDWRSFCKQNFKKFSCYEKDLHKIKDNESYYDPESDRVWFQTEYDFNPQIGWELSGADLFPTEEDGFRQWCQWSDSCWIIDRIIASSRNTILLFCKE
jgi:hypothetical protein